ncbi:MAG: hypothetical protein JNM17_21710 [Archangium sp.]|nr:hypothetical protein [Archangium sp.]
MTTRAHVITIALIITALVAVAAPPIPTLNSPIDGGWAARRPAIDYSLPGNTSPETTGAEFHFIDDLGADAGLMFSMRSGVGQQTFTGPVLPDASFYVWRGRGVDDAGLVSAWSATGTFKVDDLAPAIPAFFTATLDSGVLTLTSAATTDTQSGVDYYHFGLSRADQLDGSIDYSATFNIQPTLPTFQLFLGPGRYIAGLHVHDRVGNAFVAQSLIVAGLDVTPTMPVATPSPPEVIRFDGGTYATAPFIPTDVVRFRVDAGGITPVVGFTLQRKGRNETEWELCDFGAGPTIVQSLPAGDQDVRVAVLGFDRVSDWSAPIRVFVDESDPNTPNVNASVDAGEVLLRWPSTRDNFGGSGVTEYRIQRCCSLDASVVFPTVPHVPDASITFLDSPGFGVWTYNVAAVDRALNVGSPSVSVVTLAPNAPRNLRAIPNVTNQPIDLEWDEDRDGGFTQVWAVTRIDDNDAGMLLVANLSAPNYLDDAPEGRWSYEVSALVNPLRSPSARLDGLIRDLTPPAVDTPQVVRLGARTAEISFNAQDALSGLATVRLERDAVDLGVVTSPFTDTPPQDGTHRYRVVATDLAGNVTTTPFSADFVTPGTGLVITPVADQSLSCAQPFELTLTASESATWSLVSAPDGVSLDATAGILTWTPLASDVGVATVRVRAQGTSSVDQRDIALDVTCTRARLGVGCGCTSVDWFALAAVLLLRRRSSARSRR